MSTIVLHYTSNDTTALGKRRNRSAVNEYGVEHALEHTKDLDVSCSSLSTIQCSESLVTYAKYEHDVKARLEHGILARSTEYGFITGIYISACK